VTVSAAPTLPLTLNLSSTASAVVVPATMVVPAGSTHGTFEATIGAPPGPQQVTVTATRPPYPTGASTQITVLGPPAVLATFENVGTCAVVGCSASTPAFYLGGSTVHMKVTVSPAAGPGGAAVVVSADRPDIIAGATVTIPAGQSSVTRPFAVSANVQDSAVVSFTASLDGVALTHDVVVIPASPVKEITIAPDPVTGGVPATGTIHLYTQHSSPVTVSLSSSGAQASVPASISVPSGSKTATFPITTSPVTQPVQVAITALAGGERVAFVTVSPPRPAALTVSSPVAAGTAVAATLSLDGVAGSPLAFPLSVSDPTLATVPGTVTVQSNGYHAGFTIQTLFPAEFTAQQKTVNVRVHDPSDPATVLQSAPLVIQRPTGIVDRIAPNVLVVSSGGTFDAVLHLDMPAGPDGVTVALSANDAAVQLPASVTIPVGQTSAPFTITAAAGATGGTSTITATDGRSTITDNVTVRPPLSLVSLTAEPGTIQSGQGAQLRIEYSHPPAAHESMTLTLTADGAQVTLPATVVSGSAAVQMVDVATSAVQQITPVTITAADGGVARTTTLTLTPAPRVAAVVLDPDSVVNGQNFSGTVSLDVAGAADVTVTLSVSNPFLATPPASVVVPAGQTSVTFTMPTSTGAGTGTLTAAAGGEQQSVTFRVLPPGKGVGGAP
jgi:hypothetical protein